MVDRGKVDVSAGWRFTGRGDCLSRQRARFGTKSSEILPRAELFTAWIFPRKSRASPDQSPSRAQHRLSRPARTTTTAGSLTIQRSLWLQSLRRYLFNVTFFNITPCSRDFYCGKKKNSRANLTLYIQSLQRGLSYVTSGYISSCQITTLCMWLVDFFKKLHANVHRNSMLRS